MRTYFAYIRVSTAKQGEKGSSLTEQRDAILRYADKHGLTISEWFEEQETAAKRGRVIFRRLLTKLKKGNAHGIIMHKVDRGARNLADWAELASLMDLGIDVHFAHEALDLSSRGGRLSADIQAVVAADFIRNLRDEVKKGQQGRLKQGYYPFKAPPGYLNNGKGTLKTVDPVQGPLLREAFELYADGTYALKALCAHMKKRGLLNAVGKPFYVSGFGRILANPFYYGLMTVNGQTFLGKHEPLITKELFDRTRARAAGRLTSATRVWAKTEYRYRRLLRCTTCGASLIAETQRTRIYYRCHSESCKGTSLREEDIDREAQTSLFYLPYPPILEASLREAFAKAAEDNAAKAADLEKSFALQMAQMVAREVKLTDAFIDGLIDQTSYQSRKTALHNERILIEEAQKNSRDVLRTGERVERFIEHTKSLKNLADLENSHIFRETIKSAVSNISVCQKSVDFKWSGALSMLIDLGGFSVGVHERTQPLTCIHSVTTCEPCQNSNMNQSSRKEVKRHEGVHDRAQPLTRIHSVTGSDTKASLCIQCITDRDAAFMLAAFESRDALYQAVISSDTLDNWILPLCKDDDISPAV
jgi:site-specific DNA recombinase